jgi:hypothetical protein
MLKKIDGYKTYIVIAISILSYIAFVAGAITWEQFIQLVPLLGIVGGATIRDAIKKVEVK